MPGGHLYRSQVDFIVFIETLRPGRAYEPPLRYLVTMLPVYQYFLLFLHLFKLVVVWIFNVNDIENVLLLLKEDRAAPGPIYITIL